MSTTFKKGDRVIYRDPSGKDWPGSYEGPGGTGASSFKPDSSAMPLTMVPGGDLREEPAPTSAQDIADARALLKAGKLDEAAQKVAELNGKVGQLVNTKLYSNPTAQDLEQFLERLEKLLALL